MRWLKRIAAILLIAAVAGGTAFYLHPLWFADEAVRIALWRNGAHSRVVDLPQGRIHFYEAAARTGPGTPLVLVHGLAGRGQDFVSLVSPLTAAGFHVYAPDLLGYGSSDKPSSSDFSIATEEQVVADFMDSQQIKHAAVIGWSMGGWISLKLALDHPERVDRIVVYDAVGIVFKTDADTPLFTPTDAPGVARLIHTMSPVMKVPPPFAQRDLIRRLAADRWIIDRSIRSMKTGRDVIDAHLPSMRPPLLLIYGEQDVLTPPSVGQTMHTLNPRSVFATVAGCGHFGPVECSTPYVNLTITFLQAAGTPPPSEIRLSRSGK